MILILFPLFLLTQMLPLLILSFVLLVFPKDVPGNICIIPEPGRFASGVLYWSTMKYQVDFRGSIVGFDLGLGKFTEVPWPGVRKVFFLVSMGESHMMLLHKLDRFRRLLGLDLMHLLIVLASLKQCQGHCLPLDQGERFAWWEWVMVVSHSPQMYVSVFFCYSELNCRREVCMFGVLAARTHGLRASNILLEKD